MLLTLLLLTAQQPVAVLKSGTRIETTTEVSAGVRAIETPFGRYDASLDPVVSMSDTEEDLRLLAPLKQMDYALWLERIAERGLLTELIEAEVPEEHRALHAQLIESWGRRLDTMPVKWDKEKRIEQLWKRLAKSKDHDQLLLTGALLREVSVSQQANKRRISHADLSRALKSKDPELRRAGARLAGHQEEIGLSRKLMTLSLEEEHEPARIAMSDAAFGIDPEHSLGRWTIALWRHGPEDERVRAAGHLGNYGSEDPNVVKALIYALGAETAAMAPRSHVFFGRQIAAVTDFDVEVAASSFIADPVVTTLVEGAVLEVRVVSVTLGKAIRTSLTQLTGAQPGPKRDDWVRWYQQKQGV
ncbi:MAG: hypothetical protein ACPG31_11760 [Planctomycetota bacterium]